MYEEESEQRGKERSGGGEEGLNGARFGDSLGVAYKGEGCRMGAVPSLDSDLQMLGCAAVQDEGEVHR
jgi:hypothetical protein